MSSVRRGGVVLLCCALFLSFNTELSAQNSDSKSKQSFLSLLDEYKRFPDEFFERVEGVSRARLDAVSRKSVGLLAPAVLNARYKRYNVRYLSFLKIEKKIESEVEQLSARLKKTPLTNYKERSELELKLAALTTRYEQARNAVFLTSINAHKSLTEALKTVDGDVLAATTTSPGMVNVDETTPSGVRAQKTVAKVPPKLPGVYGGAAPDRQKMTETDKINLTPVDDAFYQTQLGKKLENDLKGRAQFWSYDFQSDELFVVVNDEVAKVTVFEDGGGVRFIRSRMGSTFQEMRSPDEKINMLNAKGRFLTGDKKQETLFGDYPETGPALAEENLPPGHSIGDGHDHSH